MKMKKKPSLEKFRKNSAVGVDRLEVGTVDSDLLTVIKLQSFPTFTDTAFSYEIDREFCIII